MKKINALRADWIASVVVIFLAAGSAFAQTDQKDINEQIWKPFVKAITNQDNSTFITLHSRDVIRVERDSKKILRYDEYETSLKSWPDWKKQNQQSGTKYVFELRFTERISNGSIAHEVGYFKNETTFSDGKIRKSYGKFHVVLRKENDIWKILVDSDSNEGRSITDDMFLAASPLE